MATLAEIRTALAASLSTITTPGLQVSAKMLANPNPPTLQVMGPDNVGYHKESMDGALWRMVVQGFVPGGIGDIPAQDLLDGWLDNEGALSVQQAVELDPTLGGVVDDATVIESTGYGVYILPGAGAVLGADWIVEVRT